jgi:hypothetical protein
MLRKKLWLFVGLIMILAGCGGASKGGDFSPRSPSGAAQAESAKTSAGFSDGEVQATSPAPPPASQPGRASADAAPRSATGGSASKAPAEPSPSTRPGLGTEYGESRTSRVHDVTFVRDSSRPFAIASLNYNDRKGVDALVAHQGSRISSRGLDSGGGAVTVSIRDSNGDPLEAVRVGDRTFVVGQAGQRYSIVLQNHTSHRFEAVATVDGLDVINGKPGSFDNRGYVLMPFATLEIDGFRQSTSTVAAFRFAAVADSYAAQMGNARNVGVIGVAFFSERGDSFVPESETRMRDTASPFPADPRFAPPPPRR